MERIDLKTLVNSSVLDQSKLKIKHIYDNENLYNGNEIEDKKKIVEYLKSFQPTWHTTQCVVDVIKNINVVELVDKGYTDGVFEWFETDIYHFENYDMPLNKEFINYVLDKYHL